MLVQTVNLSTNTVTVERGYNGTTAAPHNAEAAVIPAGSAPGSTPPALDAASTTLTVTNAAALANGDTGSLVLQIDSEQMLVTNIDLATDTITVARGYNGTTAAPHTAGAAIAVVGNPMLDPAATTIAVTNADALPAAGSGYVVQLDNEQMLVTAVNGNVLTVQRGYNGTALAFHSDAATVVPISDGAAVGTGGVNATVTVVPITNAAALAADNPGDFIIHVDKEEMLVTGVNVAAGTLTVERGYNGTTAAAHAAVRHGRRDCHDVDRKQRRRNPECANCWYQSGYRRGQRADAGDRTPLGQHADGGARLHAADR